MSLQTIRIIKKWIKIFFGSSSLHIKQNAGLYYSKLSVEGYYSDLRHKVDIDKLEQCGGVPINITSRGKKIFFPINIFQCGLGAYDLFIETTDERYLKVVLNCATWAIENQHGNGGWDTFGFQCESLQYSSMAQGEGASLLIRAFKATNNNEYISCAKKALDFMLLPTESGGTTTYTTNSIYLEEHRNHKTVLNGWIFSLWGLYDYYLHTSDPKYGNVVEDIVASIAANLKDYDRGYWSNYDLENNISSSFYHNLHINQLIVMNELFSNEEFEVFIKKWSKNEMKYINQVVAFIIKAKQKLAFLGTEETIVS